MSQGPRTVAITGGIFALVGVILLGSAIVAGIRTASFLAEAERTEGTVIDMAAKTSTSRGADRRLRTRTYYHPTVEFTVDGRRFSFEGTGANPPAYEVGDHVTVAYDPDDPSDARIASLGSAYLVPLILGGVGLVFIPVGARIFLAGRRKLQLQSTRF